MTVKTPPYLQLGWTATALGSSFGGYNVYRRPSRLPLAAWVQVAKITVPSGYTPATVETQHNQFNDYETGWSILGGQWTDGWDYAVTVVNATLGVESAYTIIQNAGGQSQTPIRDNNPWVVCNQAPFYNFPIASLQALSSADDPIRTVWRVAGRDMAVARSRIELPPRVVSLGMRVFSRLGEDPAHVYRAAASAGLTVTLLDPLGDRYIGVLEAPSALPHEAEGTWTLTGQLVETARDTVLIADYNLPAALALVRASSQDVLIADAAGALAPGSGQFSVAYFGTLGTQNVQAALIGKGTGVLNNGAGTVPGWVIGNDPASNLMEFTVADGAHGVGLSATNNGDGLRHSLIGTWNPAGGVNSQAFYLDGVKQNNGTAGSVGSIASTASVGVGSDTSSNFTDCQIQTWGYWPRALTQTEVTALHYYMAGVPGARPPGGAKLFMDLRDVKTWDGTQTANLVDLSGNGFAGAFTASPKTKGIPWNMSLVDRF